MEINVHNQTVLVAPLDWGLGHTTRCVPIIKQLLKNNNSVILGCTKLSEPIFQEEFPELKRVSLPEYSISYSRFLPLWLVLLLKLPHIQKVIKEENILLRKLVSTHKITMIISDNRYGLYHEKVRSAIICHQLNLKTPFLQNSINTYHTGLLKQFNEVWVPDYEDKNKSLAGELSENKFNLNCTYIGPLSRLTKIELPIIYDFLFLLSGPEPTQSQLLKQVIAKIKHEKLRAAIATSSEINSTEGITLHRLPSNKQLSELIGQSNTMVCRSGYSTLMDMHVLGKRNLILIPTKGQTEQEYLSEFWQKNFKAVCLPEKYFQSHKF